MIKGWKTKTGLIATATGGALLAGAELAPTPTIGIWVRFLGTILAAFGGSFALYGVADKVEKKGASQQGFIKLWALFVLAIVCILAITILGGCTKNGSFIKVKESSFCASIPPGQYSIICQVTDHFGTTPEAVRITTKLANLAGADQWYKAAAADSFLADIQVKIADFKKAGGATWQAFGAYVVGRFDLLPPKTQAAISIAKDLFEFNPPEIMGKFLSDFDWVRIEGNIADQREILMAFKKYIFDL